MCSEKKILILEDEIITALFLKKEFERRGYSVLPVISKGEDLFETVKNNMPDYIVCDIELAGELNGIEAVRHMKKDFDIPVVFLSGHMDMDIKKVAESLNPLGFIVKPFNFSQILYLLEQ